MAPPPPCYVAGKYKYMCKYKYKYNCKYSIIQIERGWKIQIRPKIVFANTNTNANTDMAPQPLHYSADKYTYNYSFKYKFTMVTICITITISTFARVLVMNPVPLILSPPIPSLVK